MAIELVQMKDENGNSIFPKSLFTLQSTTGWSADSNTVLEALNLISSSVLPSKAEHSITNGEVYTSGPAFAYILHKYTNSYYSGWLFNYGNNCVFFCFSGGTYSFTRII